MQDFSEEIYEVAIWKIDIDTIQDMFQCLNFFDNFGNFA
jgi:hypothetical protein